MADILAIAAHPDDIELNISGTLMSAAAAGRSFAICDLTQGERGTRGSAEIRTEETNAANRIMGVREGHRWNLKIPDGDIIINKENVLKVVQAIRYFRPSVLIFPWERDRHPDHEHAHQLVREAYFDAGLTHVETSYNDEPQKPFRPERLYTFIQRYDNPPDFIVDITEQFERKLDAIGAYSSQFTVPGRQPTPRPGEPETFISQPEFMEFYIARMRYWGFQIGAKYGEAYCTVAGPLKVKDLIDTV